MRNDTRDDHDHTVEGFLVSYASPNVGKSKSPKIRQTNTKMRQTNTKMRQTNTKIRQTNTKIRQTNNKLIKKCLRNKHETNTKQTLINLQHTNSSSVDSYLFQ